VKRGASLGVQVAFLVGAAFAQTAQVPGFPPFAPDPQLLEVVEATEDTVTVRHGYGETTLPRNPERILAADETTLDYLLALGLSPIGVTSYSPELPDYLAEHAGDITVIPVAGGPDSVNLEALLVLEPDLIIGYEHLGGNFAPELYEQVSQIAPTVSFLAPPENAFRTALPLLAELFNVPDRSEEALTAFEAEAAALRGRLEAALGDETVSFVTLYPRQIRLYGVGYEDERAGYLPNNVTAPLYRELGLTPGPEVLRLTAETARADLSFETLPELSADHLLIYTTLPESDLTGHPVWPLLAGRAHIVTDDTIWLGGYWGNLNRMRLWTDVLTGSTATP
jgi:ABC-type Fe3+-hydroxamate transport system substrate-binding protein